MLLVTPVLVTTQTNKQTNICCEKGVLNILENAITEYL